jgi:DEAD/DEAH box helicase domain-containing protein
MARESHTSVLPDTPHTIPQLVAHLRHTYHGRITGQVTLPAQAGTYSAFPADLDGRLGTALRARGIDQLYSHQRQAWEAVRTGHHTVIVTPTASGKTLCYNLPVLHAILAHQAKALYLFPTKALSQDQVAELLELNRTGRLGVRAYTFDGDTPADARKAVRLHGDIVVSNPDMLHQGILPHHTKWAQFFDALQYVVIDEMHTYRGVFGAHMANVIRRLRRICRFYGRNPVFILCSATIANPKELAQQLLGDDVTAVTESGAPQGEKHIMLWNPPVINADLGIRASARSQSTRIACTAVRSALKTVVFAQSRLMVEILTKYLKEAFDTDPRHTARVASYRGGYLPTERRDTERQLRQGSLDCVVSTSALELGVDIGALDVCILNGYPGTIAATWQRFGRAGRRNRPALGVLVATSAPLDQFIVRQPDFFLGASPEHARIDPNQLLIFVDHVRCAAFELPFTDGEPFGSEQLLEVLAYLETEQVLHHEGRQWHWMADSYPANTVSLRGVAEGNFVVIDITGGGKTIIAEVDYASVAMTLYEGAIYLIQAQPWQVETLDWEGRKAFVRQTKADYYTDAIDYTRLKILEQFEAEHTDGTQCARGEVHLVRRVAGYKKIRYHTHENIGYGNVNLPDQEMHTTATWWHVDATPLHQAFPQPWQALDGFLGAAYAMHHVAALLAMAEPRDLGRAVGNSDATWFATVGASGRGHIQALTGSEETDALQRQFQPTVFLYDNYPGGIGLSTVLYDLRHTIVQKAHELVAACDCAYGCPACIGPILTADEERGYAPKHATLTVLALLTQKA